MEAYSRVTRFCLVCNYVTRVIEPLASRCAKFRFKPLPVASMIERITFIAEKENVNLAEGAMNTILESAEGDMRKAVTFLQTSHQLGGASAANAVTSEIVIDISGQIPADTMSALWVAMGGWGFDGVKKAVDDIVYQGYPLGSLLVQLHDETVKKADLSDEAKAQICEKLALAEMALADGSSEALQLLDVAAYIQRRLSKNTANVDANIANH